jgi:hypothetical protein
MLHVFVYTLSFSVRRRLALAKKSSFLEAILLWFKRLSFGAIAALAPYSKPHVSVYTLSFSVRRRRYVGPLALTPKS